MEHALIKACHRKGPPQSAIPDQRTVWAPSMKSQKLEPPSGRRWSRSARLAFQRV